MGGNSNGKLSAVEVLSAGVSVAVLVTDGVLFANSARSKSKSRRFVIGAGVAGSETWGLVSSNEKSPKSNSLVAVVLAVVG